MACGRRSSLVGVDAPLELAPDDVGLEASLGSASDDVGLEDRDGLPGALIFHLEAVSP